MLQRIPQSFACKPKDWGCANFGADNARNISMSEQHELTPFEKGTIAAISALTLALRKSPGFDGDALTRHAKFFYKNPAAGCGSGAALDAYEWPLSVLTKSLFELETMVENDHS